MKNTFWKNGRPAGLQKMTRSSFYEPSVPQEDEVIFYVNKAASRMKSPSIDAPTLTGMTASHYESKKTIMESVL
jgi:hypothetical protein